jgi:hypothetical protein
MRTITCRGRLVAICTLLAAAPAIIESSESQYRRLNPGGSWQSVAWGVGGGQVVGEAYPGDQHAALWNGNTGSWVDLNPTGIRFSIAFGVSSGQQVGSVYINGDWRASLWTGTAESWVDLSPSGQ